MSDKTAFNPAGLCKTRAGLLTTETTEGGK